MSNWSILAICKHCQKIKRLDLIYTESDLENYFIFGQEILFTGDAKKFRRLKCNYCFGIDFELKGLTFD